jgi:3,4-dihydroxy 2-butanone 4-phosphate synthase/GTP cyclohydrolase II
MRAGHTEASVDLARLAGLYPAAVICEIMNDDGTMARMPDLVAFAQRHGLKIGSIEELIAYRLGNEHLVRAVAKTAVSTAAGKFDLHVYETTVEPGEHLALVKGDLSAPGPVLVRVHAVNALADLLGIGDAGEGGRQIENAMRAIDQEGRGVIVLIRDLRPKSVSEGIERRSNASKKQEDGARERRQVEIGVGSQILTDLGVRDMVLLTNSPAHVYVGLEGFGLRIVGTRRIA